MNTIITPQLRFPEFTDKLAAAQAGETLLYRVTDAGYAPVEMQGGAA